MVDAIYGSAPQTPQVGSAAPAGNIQDSSNSDISDQLQQYINELQELLKKYYDPNISPDDKKTLAGLISDKMTKINEYVNDNKQAIVDQATANGWDPNDPDLFGIFNVNNWIQAINNDAELFANPDNPNPGISASHYNESLVQIEWLLTTKRPESH